jgi:hypothetical protein
VNVSIMVLGQAELRRVLKAYALYTIGSALTYRWTKTHHSSNAAKQSTISCRSRSSAVSTISPAPPVAVSPGFSTHRARRSCLILSSVPRTLVSNVAEVTVGELFSHRTRLALGADVVDGDIKAIETRDRFVDEVADIVIVTNLGTPEPRINPFRAQLSEQCLAGFVATAGGAMRAPSFAKARAVARPMPVRGR